MIELHFTEANLAWTQAESFRNHLHTLACRTIVILPAGKIYTETQHFSSLNEGWGGGGDDKKRSRPFS